MQLYLKQFTNHSQYLSYINGSDVALPNVSYCEDQNDVHYNPLVIAQPLIATYNVEDASNPTPLFIGAESIGFSASAIYDKIEIDNVEIDMSDLSSSEQGGMTVYGYQLTNGEHTVKYTLKDPTMIGVGFDEETGMPKLGATFITCPIASVEIPNSVTNIASQVFKSCTSLTSVTIPNSVTSIDGYTFDGCTGLTNVTIGSGVTFIGSIVFNGCSNLVNITSLATIAPTINTDTFQNVKTGGTLTVPHGSSGYNTWMGTGTYYLGLYNWTKVEQ